MLLLVCGFGIAAGLAAWSAQPVAWEVPGTEPSQWLEDIVDGDSLHNGKAAMAGYYDTMISRNDERMVVNAHYLIVASVVTIMTLLSSAVAAFAGI